MRSSSSPTDTRLTNGTFSMYLGWEWVAAGILVVLMAAGLGLADFTRGYIAPALAISWGLPWFAVT